MSVGEQDGSAPGDPRARDGPNRVQSPRAAVLGFLLIAGIFGIPPPIAVAEIEVPPPSDEDDYFDLSIEQLVEMQVTSVAGVERDWFDTPSAITVLTGEKLRRSGFTSVSDALRMVPGMHVARVDARNTAVTARGVSNLFSNSLQVVIDGRVVYNDLFGGVFWDVQELLIEDIDRIEVIRGPGATLWGANAVGGVVNIITRSAKETVGSYVAGGAGTEERGFVEGRQGGRLGDKTFYRVWGRFAERDSSKREVDGGQRPDDWNIGLGGFQADGTIGEDLDWTVQGQGHRSDRFGQAIPSAGGTIVGNSKTDGGHVLARLSQNRGPRSSWQMQAYFDIEDRRGANGFDDRRDTYDISFQDRRALFERNDILWGARFRHRRHQTRPSTLLVVAPQDRDTNLGTLFIQDTVTLLPDRLFLMLGSKFEHNDMTGFEIQPGGRLWWIPNDHATVWMAISRPVRRPSIIEEDIIATTGPGTALRGDRNLDPETMIAYEIGGRVRPTPNLIFDVAAFYNQHQDLIRRSPAGGGDEVFDNVGSAKGYGVEASVFWRAAQCLRFEGSYTYYRFDAGIDLLRSPERSSPRHQFQIHSELDVLKTLSLDAALYYVSGSHVGGGQPFDIDAYVRVDLGLIWTPREWIEAAVFGQNLAGDHAEFFQAARVDTQPEIERGVYGRLKFRF